MPVAIAAQSHTGEFDLGGKFRAPSDEEGGRRPSKVVVGNGMDHYSFFDEQNRVLTEKDKFATYPCRKLMYLVVAQFFLCPAIVISQGVLAVTTINFELETALNLGAAGVFLVSGLVAYASNQKPSKGNITSSVVFGGVAFVVAVGIIVLTEQLIERISTTNLTFNFILIFICGLEIVVTIMQVHHGMSYVSSCDLTM